MNRKRRMRAPKMDWKGLISYEILYKLFGIVLMVPLFSGAFSVMLQLSGYRYLTRENLFSFLTNPFILCCILIFMVLGGLYQMLDIGVILYILRYHRRGCRPEYKEAFFFGVKYMLYVLREGRIGAILIAGVLILPFESSTMFPVFLSRTVLKDLSSGILHEGKYRLPVLAALFAGAVIFFCFKYVFFLIRPHKKGIRYAVKESILIGARYWVSDLVIYLLAQLLYLGLFFLTAMAGIAVTIGIEQLMRRFGGLQVLSNFVVLTVLNIIAVLYIVMNGPFSNYMVAFLLQRHFGESRVDEKFDQLLPEWTKEAVRENIGFTVMAAGLILICGYYSYASYKGRFNPNIEYVHTTEVTAHRGASRHYPENTMAAFVQAVELGTDWIELDIQQSRDGVLFVMHDSDFRRTTGVKAKAWELDWEEISTLDAGSWKSRDFAGEPVPLLADVIDFAKENSVLLNIELKPTGNEPDFEQHLVELLQEKEFIGNCLVTSQVYHSLRKVKELDESIQTAYVTSFAYGNVNALAAADYFSIKTGSLNDALVSGIHNAGKQVLAWTVNSRYMMHEMIEMQVDNIITDDVALAKMTVGESRTTDAVWTYVRWLRHLFRFR